MSMALCSMSTASQSKPAWARISATRGFPIETQVPIEGSPLRSFSITTFLRITLPPVGLSGSPGRPLLYAVLTLLSNIGNVNRVLICHRI